MSFPTPFGYGGNAPQLQSQFSSQRNEHEALSDIEYRALKKPRVSVALNREMKCRFIKTQLCERFNLGMCLYGDKCTYAHGIEEMRKPVPLCHEVVAEKGHFDMNGNGDCNISKCRMFRNGGTCTYGDRCRFLHDVPKKWREDADTSFVNPKPVIHKTRLCTKWELTGGCRFGKTCCFAHGQAELNYGYYAAAESKNVKCRTVAGPKVGRSSSRVLVTPVREQVSAMKCIFKCRTVAGPKVGRSSSRVLVTPVREQVSAMKCIFKWKVVGKIDGIYADWINDVPAATHA